MAVIAGMLVGSMAACGEDDTPGRQVPPIVIDERAGRVNGARLGDDGDAIRRHLGAPRTEGFMLPTTPNGIEVEDIGLPWTLDPIPGVRITEVLTMRYAEMTVDVAPWKGAYAFYVWRPDARTTSGVSIGDRLQSAQRQGRRLRCGVRNRHGEYGAYPYCTGRVGDNMCGSGRTRSEASRFPRLRSVSRNAAVRFARRSNG